MRGIGALTALLALAVVPAASAATYRVTTTADSGPGSLRAAVSSVNAGSGGDTISIPAGTYVLTSGQLDPTRSVTITGAGAASTVLEANGNDTIFYFNGNASQVTISGLTLTNGNYVGSGGAIVMSASGAQNLTISDSAFTNNTAAGVGGAIYMSNPSNAQDTMTLTRTVFFDNSTQSGGAVEFGGAPNTQDSLTVTDSSFVDNSVSLFGGALGAGGGNSSHDTLLISGSTFSGNTAGDGGGGLYLSGGTSNTDTATIVNSTLTGNLSASGYGAGAHSGATTTHLINDTIDANTAKIGGGFDASSSSATVTNTILSGNPGGNCNEPLTSGGHNVDSGSNCGLSGSTDQVNTDPRLGSLAGNGGPTATQALQSTSPAIDHGGSSACPSTDQRGVLRPQGATCDVGSFEVAVPVVITGAPSGVGGSSAKLNGAVANPGLGAANVVFQWGTTSAYGSQATGPSVPAGAGATAVSAGIAGLAPGTTYHYRVVATNPDGTSYGPDRAFTTPTSGPGGGGSGGGGGGGGGGRGHGSGAPRLSKLRLTRHRQRTTISYRDSQAAHTTIKVQRCASRPRRGPPRAARRCTRYVTVGSLTHTDSAGINRVVLTRRLRGRALKAGRYRLVAVARNSAGQASAPVRISFLMRGS